MSLEQAITENTNALRDLIARLSHPNAITMSATEFLQDHNKVEAPKSSAADTTATATTKVSTVADTAKTETKVEKTETETLDYEKQVKPFLVKVSQEKGRDTLIALLAKFDVTKGDQLPAEKLAAVLANANELLAA